MKEAIWRADECA